MSEKILSVRARHKLQTISLIHSVAVNLTLAKGLADATVEDIAAATGISKRTFFNYFPTKEDAVLGLQAPSLPDGVDEQFNSSEQDTLTRTAMLIIAVTRTTAVPGSTAKRRKELRERFPELVSRFEIRAVAAEAIVRPILVEYLARDGETVDQHEVDVVLRMAAAVIRYAYVLDPEITDASIAQSITTFKATIRKIL